MTNKEKFLALVSKEKTDTLDRINERIEKREQLRESARIAYKVLDRLDELKWTQKRLAKELNVSPQQVTKIVKGQENMTLATMVKLQEVLNIPILASFHENAFEKLGEMIGEMVRTTFEKPEAKIIDMKYDQTVSIPLKKMVLGEPTQRYERNTLSA